MHKGLKEKYETPKTPFSSQIFDTKNTEVLRINVKFSLTNCNVSRCRQKPRIRTRRKIMFSNISCYSEIVSTFCFSPEKEREIIRKEIKQRKTVKENRRCVLLSISTLQVTHVISDFLFNLR